MNSHEILLGPRYHLRMQVLPTQRGKRKLLKPKATKLIATKSIVLKLNLHERKPRSKDDTREIFTLIPFPQMKILWPFKGKLSIEKKMQEEKEGKAIAIM